QGDAAMIEAADRLLLSITQNVTGDARLYFTGIDAAADTTTVYFDYVLDGRPVRTAAGHGASVTYTGGYLCALSVYARTYTLTDQSVSALPPLQAAALLPRGANLQLTYADVGAGALQYGWAN
ncbi:MAG: hypothetical protein PHS97_03515, partial [Oscillospiraceae bacterium]|nr:hypothetical protein [Oscillospiraceae bacterium]